MLLISILKKTILRILYGARYSEKTYIEYLKKRGATIGENLRLFSPESISIDIQNPHLLEIGDNVRITQGCCILTHDYSYSVISGFSGEVLSGFEKVVIGTNVFIGVNSIILKGSRIGNNVIIGAGSVVSGILEDDSVYAGIPAKRLMSLKEYTDKRKIDQETNAIEFVRSYRESYNSNPDISKMHEFMFLWRNDLKSLSVEELELAKRTGYLDKIEMALNKNIKKYKDYDNFLENV